MNHNDFSDRANHIGTIWSRQHGWHMPPFPDVPAKYVALCVNNKISGMTDRGIEKKLIELGFNPSYRYLGSNNPRDKNDPTSLLFFLRKYNRDDQAMDEAIMSLINGGIPPRAIVVITHKLYCAILGIGCDRADNRRDD
ncbi:MULTISPECIES: hypothetical protein [unclassified Coleofasciculus]|uniref:hypothetical protein n=1 Tax=unclassified Coleofasciculus TaxID=2692782 RepID=UPI00187E79D6|nr:MULTISPECIES: hypothetical protein [unclassified Coleofasciculus]MBE9129512.1 hypothetical protein [Coleofasciculus sp. LEGE 07081]MBE9151870.1 hypothetical protein [Coleofasciculus sp. LEGE 07092]